MTATTMIITTILLVVGIVGWALWKQMRPTTTSAPATPKKGLPWGKVVTTVVLVVVGGVLYNAFKKTALQQAYYAKEDAALAAEEKVEAAKVDAVKIDPTTGLIDSVGRETMRAGAQKMASLKARRAELKRLMEGKSTTHSAATSSSGAIVDKDVVIITRPGEYVITAVAAPITVKVKGCYRLDWDARGNPVKITLPDGREFIEPVGPQTVEIPGNNPQFQVQSLDDIKVGEFVIVASRK